jgi:hypothetical protein
VASSQPPPPTTGSSTPYVIGAVVLALLAFGLYRWKASSGSGQPQITTVTAAPTADDVPVLNAPPPPPKVEEIPDAGDDAAAPTQPKVASGGSGGCGGKCDNPPSPALQSALRGAAQNATGCYQRSLRTGQASGKMMVSVTVGPNGSVCGARIAQDEVHSGEVSSCVLSRFNGRQFPQPGSGCATVQIPINFVAK